MRFGDFDLISLSDGFFGLDGGAMFGIVPKPLWSKRLPADDRNRVRLGLRPLLVRTPSAVVLIDAGIGDKMSPKDVDIYAIDHQTSIDRSLAEAGLSPSDIDIVVMTHLHFDHAGALTTRTPDGVLVPQFPRARHLIRRGEWDDATHPHERNRVSYRSDAFLPLADAGLVDFIDADRDVVPGVRVERTGGHTLHHQIVRLTSGGRTAVYAADILPTVAHLDVAWIMGFDLYPVDTITAKRALLAEASERGHVIFFEHDPALPAGIIRRTDARLHVEPVAGFGQ